MPSQPHALLRRDSKDYDEAHGGSHRSRAVVTAGSVGEMLVWYAPLTRLRAIQILIHWVVRPMLPGFLLRS